MAKCSLGNCEFDAELNVEFVNSGIYSYCRKHGRPFRDHRYVTNCTWADSGRSAISGSYVRPWVPEPF